MRDKDERQLEQVEDFTNLGDFEVEDVIALKDCGLIDTTLYEIVEISSSYTLKSSKGICFKANKISANIYYRKLTEIEKVLYWNTK